jgi:hypothetical protein
MSGYTVAWDMSARHELARLWLDNPRLRNEISAASDTIDVQLAMHPLYIGLQMETGARQYVEPPLKVLYRVYEQDRLVRVLYVKHWFD